MRRLFLLLALSLSASPARAVAPIQGNWYTADRSAIVHIAPCGSHMCGTIARVLNQGPNVPTRDVNNPDSRLRSRPILGMAILTGFSPAGAQWTGGQAYDPQSGRSYRARLAVRPNGTLEVTGCVMFICQSRDWTRAR
ncbi:MAG TPA: DUF2147 domain-containing protein [Allosphingosinicella sp.]